MTSADAWAAALLATMAFPVVAAYLLDAAGVPFFPVPMLLAAAAAAVCVRVLLRAGTVPDLQRTRILLAVVGATAAWLVWLAWPSLLPLGTGPDLTHHLILIRYIEEHWRLVHDPGLERYLGEMAQYTPGSHVLAALAGAWSATDGLRALHVVQSVAVALKAGLLWLIAVRLIPARAPKPLAMVGVLLLLAAPQYFLRGFTEYGFVAQVIAETFAVAMWWCAVLWADAPDWRAAAMFAVAAAATFLTWPVYVGAPSLTLFVIVALRTDHAIAARLRHLAVAFVPLGAVAGGYLVGRLGWLQLAGTGGAAPTPSVAAYSGPLVALAGLGLIVCMSGRGGRATALFTFAVLAQAAAFYAIALRAHASQPYMSQKMFYLLLWPMCACAAAAAGAIWTTAQRTAAAARNRFSRVPGASRGQPGRGVDGAIAWLVVALVAILVARPLARSPQRIHPLPPAVSASLYEAGRWARVNLPPGCIEYLVGDDETAYWLHLAVLGNPRMSARTGDDSTYEPKDAVVRWLTPDGLPYAIADLPALPRTVRDELEIVRQFGTAAIARRRGPATCDPG
jgi:hypothetical protein